MFWKKNKKAAPQERFVEVSLGGAVLFSGGLMDLPLKEEWVLKKSVEFFGDPEPCYIHRGAVAARLLDEIWEKAGGGETASEYADFPEGSVVRAVFRPQGNMDVQP